MVQVDRLMKEIPTNRFYYAYWSRGFGLFALRGRYKNMNIDSKGLAKVTLDKPSGVAGGVVGGFRGPLFSVV